MNDEDRTNPEELLQAVKSLENKRGKGRLKIFLGMAPGVGKTYLMLQTAQKKMKEGVDLAVGIVDSHGRSETEKLLEGLKHIPENIISYKGREFKEFNLDKALELKPQLVIIDEMAHTNIPGSRHEKRWQDILELLDAGLDVYTTLNVQHIESFKDVVQEIAEIRIFESVPDLMLERASDIELVDLTPQELLERLKEGKVYTREMSRVAVQNFFQEDRLTALREIALLLTAEIVDKELQEMIATIQKRKGWKPRERLLIAIDQKANAQQLIRAARRRAFTLHAPWTVVYVDVGQQLNDAEREMLNRNLALARALGAEVITTKDSNIAQGIQRIAQQKEATEIIIGKTSKIFRRFFRPSLVNQLVKLSGHHNVRVTIQTLSLVPEKKKMPKIGDTRSVLSYFHILFWIAVVSVFCGYIAALIGYKVVGFIFLLSTFILSLFFKKAPLLLAAVLFTLIWDYFFIPPVRTLFVSTPADISFLVLFFILALILGMQTRRIQDKQELLIKREQTTQALYEIARAIVSAPTELQVFEDFKKRVGAILDGRCEITINADGLSFDESFDTKERAVAKWVLENGREAGWSTPTLASARNLHIPLKGFKETVGVLSYHPSSPKSLTFEESDFLHTAAQQLALYIERSLSETKEREHLIFEKIKKIHNKVLHAIGHELQHPLQNISGVLLKIKKEPALADHEQCFGMIRQIENSTETLLRLLENVAAMEKLSAGFIEFHKSLQDVHDLINACCKKVEKLLEEHQLIIRAPEELPKVTFDFSLMEILLNNLLLNAIQYSPVGTTIEIAAEQVDGSFILSVADEGPGIPDEIIGKIFEQFYRAPGARAPGLGLGLAIVSSIAALHHGEVRVQNRPTGGAQFSLILPG